MNPAAFNPAYFFLFIYNFLIWLFSFQWAGGASASVSFFNNLAAILAPIGTFLWLLFAAGIVYCSIRIWQIREAEHKKLAATPASIASTPAQKTERPGALAWQEVLEKVGSQNPADWRVAILEADIILDEALGEAGYSGTIGDKLKSIPKSNNFPLDAAWGAHNVRNQIAHEGAGFDLTEREVKRAIGLYQVSLESLHYI